MSDDSKELSFGKEEQEKVLKWLGEKWKNNGCECCGGKDWSIADFIVATPGFQNGNTILGGKTIPLVQVICDTCGNVKQFAALQMGLLEKREGAANV